MISKLNSKLQYQIKIGKLSIHSLCEIFLLSYTQQPSPHSHTYQVCTTPITLTRYTLSPLTLLPTGLHLPRAVPPSIGRSRGITRPGPSCTTVNTTTPGRPGTPPTCRERSPSSTPFISTHHKPC